MIEFLVLLEDGAAISTERRTLRGDARLFRRQPNAKYLE
jgi:hypothetical protein